MSPDECTSVFASLSAYLDRELEGTDCAKLEEHIKDCAPCIEFLESLKKSVRLGQQYEPREEPRPLSEETRARLEQYFRERTGG